MKYTIDNYEEFAIDYLEGNLNNNDRLQFEAFLILHPEIKETLDDFSLVQLPGFHPTMPSKEKLYRKEIKVIPVFNYFRAIAAVILLLLIFGLFMQKSIKNSKDQIVRVEKEVSPKLEAQPLEAHPVLPQIKNEPDTEKSTALSVVKTQKKPRIESMVSADKKVEKKPNSAREIPKKENGTQNLVMDYSPSKTTEKKENQMHQTVVFIENINIIPEIKNYYQIEERPTYLFIEQDKKEDTVSKIGKLLAKANLIPTGLREEITESNLREKVIPESYMDFK